MMTLSLMLMLFGAAGARAPDPAGLERILDQARRVQEADVAAWTRHRFRRVSRRERLDADDRVTWREDLEFLVTPSGDGFDELLERIDGREPTPQEIARHREAGRFSRAYAVMRGKRGGDSESGYSLAYLLRMSSYRLGGTEPIEGVECYRLDFSPGPVTFRDGLAGRVVQVMSGTLWLTVDGLHIMKASAHSVEPVPIAFGLAKVSEVKVAMAAASVGRGVWLPARIEMLTAGHILGRSFRKRHLLVYSDFSPSEEVPGRK